MSQLHDEGLPTLAAALSLGGIGAAWAAVSAQPLPASDSHATVIKHVSGRRATVLYSFGGQTEAPKRIIGKLYRSDRRAARMHRRLIALNGEAFPGTTKLRVPNPAGLSEELRMVLHDYIEGEDLRHALDQQEPFALAAQWLARLHGAAPLEELKVRTVVHEGEKALQWLDRTLHHAPPELRTRLDAARERLASVLASPPSAELCTIHRDYYYANVLWDGHCLWAIDLDQLRLGDPALDVAHFMAHLQVLAYRQTGDFNSYAVHSECFLSAYREERPTAEIDQRLPMYAAYTFLKLAATEADRARAGWQIEYEALATRACTEIERIP